MKILNKLIYLQSQVQSIAKYQTFNYAKDIPASY